MNEIELAKAVGKFRLAGQLQALYGLERYYGCHYGLRGLNRAWAVSEFYAGWDEVDYRLRVGDY